MGRPRDVPGPRELPARQPADPLWYHGWRRPPRREEVRIAAATPAEQQILEVGRRLLDALPAPSRHSLRAVDDRAIDLDLP